MKGHKSRAGFSLMEVNMAVFVMAISILGMVALYPLGLRESTQGAADLKQAMFADFVLNQAVAAASQTNLTWSQWSSVPRAEDDTINLKSSVPGFIKSYLDPSLSSAYPTMQKDVHYRIACCLVPGGSDKIMGIMVQSTELTKNITSFDQITNNPIYYAEVLFQGDPTQ